MQQSTNALISSLIARGHYASVLCALMPNGVIGKLGRLKIKLSKVKYAKDYTCDYPIYRSWFPWEAIENVVKVERPDVIVVLTRLAVKMALAARVTGVPCLMMLQDVEFNDHGGDFKELGDMTCVANSAFTASKYQDAFGVHPSIIHPIIFPDKYKTNTTREYVTYINPHPQKGLDVALAVAKSCPDIPFLFQEAWPLSPDQLNLLKKQIAILPNVIFQRCVSDARQVYKRTKILLVPSKWEESYGRVASEAHFSGIPVVASNIGGLPEAVGNGGILINSQVANGDVSEWVEAINDLWNDNALYQKNVDAAFAMAKSLHQDTDQKIEKWIKILSNITGNLSKIKM